MCTRSQTKNLFFYYNVNQKSKIICCKNFIIGCFQTIGFEKLANILRIDCVLWFEKNDSVCCSRDIRMENYCPPYLMKVLVEFNKDLYNFNNIVWFFLFLAEDNNEKLYLWLSFWLLQLFNSVPGSFFCRSFFCKSW